MNLKKLFGIEERNPESMGFGKSYETSFSQENSAVHQDTCRIVSIKYNTDSEFFINPEKNITYMIGNIENYKVSVPGFEDVETELKQQLNENYAQRILAYSECRDGTSILTGNLGVEALDNIFGGATLRISNEFFIDGKILRNIKQRNVDKVLRNHKNYVSDLEIVSNPRLAERLAGTYQELNNYLIKI